MKIKFGGENLNKIIFLLVSPKIVTTLAKNQEWIKYIKFYIFINIYQSLNKNIVFYNYSPKIITKLDFWLIIDKILVSFIICLKFKLF